MGRYDILFKTLSEKKEGAFVPFGLIGDPDLEQSFRVVEAMIDGGGDALELGIPFSDPIADGPVIQAAGRRALASGTTPDLAFEFIERLRRKYPSIPIGLLVYANLVCRKGVNEFYSRAAECGVDSVLVADVPLFESAPFFRSGERFKVDTVFIVPPRVRESSLRGIARISRGYTYVLARSGVTGDRASLELEDKDLFARLANLGAAPCLVGFGISKPEHVRAVLDAGAAGAISGSAITRIVEKHLSNPEEMCATVKQFVASMKDGTRFS